MKKAEFTLAIRSFRDDTEGAACFYDLVRDLHHCANKLTRQQAEKFAEDNELELKDWRPGESCSDINCGG